MKSQLMKGDKQYIDLIASLVKHGYVAGKKRSNPLRASQPHMTYNGATAPHRKISLKKSSLKLNPYNQEIFALRPVSSGSQGKQKFASRPTTSQSQGRNFQKMKPYGSQSQLRYSQNQSRNVSINPINFGVEKSGSQSIIPFQRSFIQIKDDQSLNLDQLSPHSGQNSRNHYNGMVVGGFATTTNLNARLFKLNNNATTEQHQLTRQQLLENLKNQYEAAQYNIRQIEEKIELEISKQKYHKQQEKQSVVKQKKPFAQQHHQQQEPQSPMNVYLDQTILILSLNTAIPFEQPVDG